MRQKDIYVPFLSFILGKLILRKLKNGAEFVLLSHYILSFTNILVITFILVITPDYTETKQAQYTLMTSQIGCTATLVTSQIGCTLYSYSSDVTDRQWWIHWGCRGAQPPVFWKSKILGEKWC